MLAAVLGIFLLVVFYFDLSIHRKIDQLANGHAGINPHRLLNGYLQRPVAAKTNISFTGRCMYVDTQPARA